MQQVFDEVRWLRAADEDVSIGSYHFYIFSMSVELKEQQVVRPRMRLKGMGGMAWRNNDET